MAHPAVSQAPLGTFAGPLLPAGSTPEGRLLGPR